MAEKDLYSCGVFIPFKLSIIFICTFHSQGKAPLIDFFFLHSEDLYFSGLKFISFTSLANNFNFTLNSKGLESPGLWNDFFLQPLNVFLLDSTFLDYLVLSWLGDNSIFGELGPESFKPSQAASTPSLPPT